MYRILAICISLIFLFISMGCSESKESKSIWGHAAHLYTEGQRILGFEDHNDWSNSNQNSTIHSEGAQSIQVIPNGWTEVQSVALSSLGIVMDKISVDVRMPEIPPSGDITIIVRVPSRGIYYRQLETIPMSSLTAGQFSTVSFIMPTDVAEALNGSYSDLNLSIVLNTPSMTQPILLDNMQIVELDDDTDSSGTTGEPLAYTKGNTRDFIFSLPGNVSIDEAFMTASESIRLSNAVTVASEKAVISNLGKGLLEMNTDVSLGGDVYALGDVSLADRVSINGFLRLNGTLTQGNDVVIADGVENIQVAAGMVIDWTTVWPEATESLFIDNTQIQELAVGAHNSIRVQPGGTLILNPGNFYVNEFFVEKGGRVVVNGNGSPVILYVKDTIAARGEVVHSQSSEDFLIAYGGTSIVDLDAPFGGTVVAPFAELRLAPLNGATHEGSFVGRRINAEANNEIILKPFAHWDYLKGLDACTPVSAYFDCSTIAAWEQKEYIRGDRVTDGSRVYEVYDDERRTLAGSSPEYAPSSGTSWLEAWHVDGTCNTADVSGDFMKDFSAADIDLYFTFDEIITDDNGKLVAGTGDVQARIVGDDAYVRENSRRSGCTTGSSVLLNSRWAPEYSGGIPPASTDLTYLEFEKSMDTDKLSVLMQLKTSVLSSQTFVSFANATQTSLAIGYSEQNGFYVHLGDAAGTHYSGKAVFGDIAPGEWMDIAVVIEGQGDGTSTVQFYVNNQSLFTDGAHDSVTMNGTLDLTSGKWVIGAYQDALLGTTHTQLVGELGSLLLTMKSVNPRMAPDIIGPSEQISSVENDITTVGKEAQLNTNAPDIDIPDPMKGYKELATPEINTQGRAEVRYPFELPTAVVGPTPTLALQCLSDKKDGNAGIGWNLSISRIEFDTSDEGVPDYHGPAGDYTNLIG